MSRKINDVTQEEIEAFRRDIEEISTSTKLTMPEKSERIKLRTKQMLRDFSYLDLFDNLKDSKVKGNSKQLYGSLYEQALEELLEEKKKSLTMEEIDDVLQHFQDETNKTRKFIKETSDSLLSEEEIKEKSRKLTEDDLNYKRLAVAAKEGNLTEEQKAVFENEGKKVDIIAKQSNLNVLDKYEESISKELSQRINEEEKVLPSVKAAVDWWCDELTDKHSGDESVDLGNSDINGLASSFKGFISSQIEVTEDQIKIFRKELTKKCMKLLEYPTFQDLGVRLFTDYRPINVLAEAAEAAKIDSDKFPFKTNMHVYLNKVTVFGGKGKNGEIFNSETENKKNKSI